MSNKYEIFVNQLQQYILSTVKTKYPNLTLKTELLRSVRDTIKECIITVFKTSKHKISDESTSWLCNQFFKVLEFEDAEYGKVKVGDYVVFNDHELSDMSSSDLFILKTLFESSVFGPELTEESNRRSNVKKW